MREEGNADTKMRERNMEREDSVRTVDCLRGRLLAERVASRNANEEAQQLGNKLMELENILKQEAKSKHRAEKKLKHLMKKLQSMNISYISDESEYSGFVDKTEISSPTSSIPKSQQLNNENRQTEISEANSKSEKDLEKLQQNDSRNYLSDDNSAFEVDLLEFESDRVDDPILPTGSEIDHELSIDGNAMIDDSSFSAADENSEKSSSKTDEQSDIYQHTITSADEVPNDEDDQESDNQFDNTLALVPVSTPQENHTIDPQVLDATVKEVLDALRLAKERLQNSMERRRMNMIRVG